MFLTHLSCTSCGLHHDWGKLQNLCTACRKPLFAVYDLERAGRALKRDALLTRAEKSLWRYRELLQCRSRPHSSHSVKGERLCFAPEDSASPCKCRISGSKTNHRIPLKVSKRAGCQSPFRWRNILAPPNSLHQAPAMPAAPSPPTPRGPDSKPTSSCHATHHGPILSNAASSVHASP